MNIDSNFCKKQKRKGNQNIDSHAGLVSSEPHNTTTLHNIKSIICRVAYSTHKQCYPAAWARATFNIFRPCPPPQTTYHLTCRPNMDTAPDNLTAELRSFLFQTKLILLHGTVFPFKIFHYQNVQFKQFWHRLQIYKANTSWGMVNHGNETEKQKTSQQRAKAIRIFPAGQLWENISWMLGPQICYLNILEAHRDKKVSWK